MEDFVSAYKWRMTRQRLALCHVTITSCMLFEFPFFISLDSFHNYSIQDILLTQFYRKIVRSFLVFHSQVS